MYCHSSWIGTVFILVNLGKSAQTVTLPRAMEEVLAGGVEQSVALPVYGVAVVSTRR